MDASPKGAPLQKILLADDDAVIRKMVSEYFSSRGSSVTAVADGVEACRLAEAQEPDVILVDLLLPRRDGYAVLLHLRSHPRLREIPVIFLSGEPAGEQYAISQALGVQGYLQKPISLQKIDQSVREVLRASRERSAIR